MLWGGLQTIPELYCIWVFPTSLVSQVNIQIYVSLALKDGHNHSPQKISKEKIKPSSWALLCHLLGVRVPHVFPRPARVSSLSLALGMVPPPPGFHSCGKRAVPCVSRAWHRHIPGIRRDMAVHKNVRASLACLSLHRQKEVCHPPTPQIWFLDCLSLGCRGCSSTICLPSAVLVNTF